MIFCSLWHVTHTIVCKNHSSWSCSQLSLSSIECNLPLCPNPNDTLASGLDTLLSNAILLTLNTSRKVGEQIQFRCSTPGKNLLMQANTVCMNYLYLTSVKETS